MILNINFLNNLDLVVSDLIQYNLRYQMGTSGFYSMNLKKLNKPSTFPFNISSNRHGGSSLKLDQKQFS